MAIVVQRCLLWGWGSVQAGGGLCLGVSVRVCPLIWLRGDRITAGYQGMLCASEKKDGACVWCVFADFAVDQKWNLKNNSSLLKIKKNCLSKTWEIHLGFCFLIGCPEFVCGVQVSCLYSLFLHHVLGVYFVLGSPIMAGASPS